jgi:tripartite-type tricarboxylate transporter receptor subunit TctC
MAQSLSVRMIVGGAAVTVVLAGAALAAGVEDFYKGRSPTLVIGYSAGAGYDAYARLLGCYFGKHVSRNPSGAGRLPLATDLVKAPEQMQIIKLLLVSQAMARPFAAPPDSPAERKAALLAAFDSTMKDDEFLAEANDVRPVNAAKIDTLLADVYQTPKDVIARATKAIASEGQ